MEETHAHPKTVRIGTERVENITSTDYPYNYFGETTDPSIEQLASKLKVIFHRNHKHESVFSLVGVDASIANALRRILLSHIPTLAIEDVYIRNNTSVIQDEVLAHRLGLVPLAGSKEGLRWLRERGKADEEDGIEQENEYDHNTVVITLNAKCEWKKEGKKLAEKGETDPLMLYDRAHIYARDLVFHALGKQQELFSEEKGAIRPSHPDILLAKLRPGQVLDMTCHATKGVGFDHTKFSPVATATYRLLPTIEIKEPIRGNDARKFARCFPKGVIGLEEEDGDVKAVVKDTFRDTVSRECLRHDEFKDKVKLGRVRDHFIYSIESTGQYDSDEMFLESVRLLKAKCLEMKECVQKLKESS